MLLRFWLAPGGCLTPQLLVQRPIKSAQHNKPLPILMPSNSPKICASKDKIQLPTCGKGGLYDTGSFSLSSSPSCTDGAMQQRDGLYFAAFSGGLPARK